MKLVLHIGAEKTGSTLLQDWLYSNQDTLSEQGVFLSDKIGRNNNGFLVAYFQQDPQDFFRRHSICNDREREHFFDGFLGNFRNEILHASRTHQTMVVTSELFHSRLRTVDELQNLYQFLAELFDRISVVLYVREQSEMRRSLYSTALKGTFEGPLSTFQKKLQPDFYYYNFFKVASLWAEVFGRENVNVRLFDRKEFVDGDIRLDFLNVLPTSVDRSRLSFDVETANESLSYLEGRAFRSINKTISYWSPDGGVNRINKFLKRVLAKCSALKVGTNSDDMDDEVRRIFSEPNRKLFDEYFGGEKTFRFRNIVDRTAEPEVFSLEQVGDVVEGMTETIAETLGPRCLLNKDGELLRDVALKAEKGRPITREEALALMKLAARARPNGRFIQRKIKEWDAE